MKELLRTTDIVRLSFLSALLRDAGVEPLVLDSHMSVLEGSANAIPRRLAVRDEDFSRAKWVLEESGEQLDED
jgi:putative signal transducing protein